MRKIKMIGTANALPPYQIGQTVFVTEGEAHLLSSVGELAYVYPSDEVSAAHAQMLLWAASRRNLQIIADATGVERWLTESDMSGMLILPESLVGPPLLQGVPTSAYTTKSIKAVIRPNLRPY